MTVFLLWAGIVTLTVGLVAIAVNLLRRMKRQDPIHDAYMFILSVYEMWIAIYTYVFFVDVFLLPVSPFIRNAMALVRMLISLGLFAGYICVLRESVSVAKRKGVFAGGLFLCVVFCGLYLWLLLHPDSFGLAATLSYGYYAALLLIVVLLIVGMHSASLSWPAHIRFFLWTSAVFFLVQIPLSSLFFQLHPNPVFRTLPRLLFCVLLSVTDSIRFFHEQNVKESRGFLSDSFLKAHSITAREREVIEQIFKGASMRKTGEALCISEKTVNTHLQNIYKKCGVNGKIELIHLAKSYE